jgi:hypothetical protein
MFFILQEDALDLALEEAAFTDCGKYFFLLSILSYGTL